MLLCDLFENRYIFSSDMPVYHGSKQRAIKDFIKKKGFRAAWFDTTEVMANGFFFAVTPQDAQEYGPYVSEYRIRATKPLIFGYDGVDPIKDIKRKADIRYVLSALLKKVNDDPYVVFNGMQNDVFVKIEDINNNDLEQDDDWIYQFIGSGGIDWEVLDNPVAVQRMRERGYDSTVAYEKSLTHNSWFVLDANQIKFVKEI